MGQFFSSHLSHFFCCIIRKYLSHILFCTQLVSVCYTMKLYFLLQNTLDTNVRFVSYLGWAIFFHRHTCHAFFAVSSKNIYPTYCFGHSSSQSVSQWNSFSPLKYIVYKCFSYFRPGMALFVSSSHLSRFFCCIIRKYLSHILFWSQLVSVCFGMKFFSSFKKTLSTNVTVVSDQGWANFFHRHTFLHLSRFFCCIIRKYLSHILFWSKLVSVCFALKFFFSFKIHCLQMLQLFQTKDGPIFFHRHTCLHLSRFFCCIIRKYLSHILLWSQLVSVCFAMKFFFSFKIYCLQMFQLFQTRDGPFFFIVTLVFTCCAFFAVSSENICSIYCFGHSSSQSVSHWNFFPPLKYIVYKCYSCFRPGMGQFFSSSHLSTLVTLFLLHHQKIFVPYIFGCIIKTFEEKISLYKILYMSI